MYKAPTSKEKMKQSSKGIVWLHILKGAVEVNSCASEDTTHNVDKECETQRSLLDFLDAS